MPRIHAPSVAEHVAQQHAAVLGAAIELFIERGYSEVTFAEIAERVGLARNSLYRYFPDKAHILAAWFERTMESLLTASEAIAARSESAVQRLRRWVNLQLDFVLDPEHDAMIEASLSSPDLPAEIRVLFAERHRQLYASLETILIDGGVARAAASRRALLIAGLIRSGSDLKGRGVSTATTHTDVTAAAVAVAALTK